MERAAVCRIRVYFVVSLFCGNQLEEKYVCHFCYRIIYARPVYAITLTNALITGQPLSFSQMCIANARYAFVYAGTV